MKKSIFYTKRKSVCKRVKYIYNVKKDLFGCFNIDKDEAMAIKYV